MQLTCEQPDLLKGVQAVTRAISTRTTMPILSNILLQSTKDGIKLAATDLELGIQTIVPASVKKGGALTLPARLLSEIVSNLSAATVEFRVEEGGRQAEIRCEEAVFEILGLPATDFPFIPEPDATIVATLEAGLLRGMVRQTAFAVSTDETRPFLTGVFFSTVALAENHLVFSLPDVRLVSRLIAGQFPNYQQVIPQGYKQKLRLQTERFLRAVRRVAITARDSANVVRLSATGAELTIT